MIVQSGASTYERPVDGTIIHCYLAPRTYSHAAIRDSSSRTLIRPGGGAGWQCRPRWRPQRYEHRPRASPVAYPAPVLAAGQPSGTWSICRVVSPIMEARQAAEAREQVTALYREHALGLVKLAVLMVGDQLTAEDVAQEAFLGLYRRWTALQDQEKALSYV